MGFVLCALCNCGLCVLCDLDLSGEVSLLCYVALCNFC